MVEQSAFWERSTCIRALFGALTCGDVPRATEFFAHDAHLLRVHYSRGRVESGETLARGRAAIGEWLTTLVDRQLAIRAAMVSADGGRVVVHARWALLGFHGERLRSSTVAIVEFVGPHIFRISVRSHDDVAGEDVDASRVVR